MVKKLVIVGATSLALVAAPGLGLASADAVGAKKFSNCASLNKVYKHGVGKKGARDRVTSGKPVTNFTRNNKVYKQNKSGRDRDKDGVACEKH
jgi:hypothetical protein